MSERNILSRDRGRVDAQSHILIGKLKDNVDIIMITSKSIPSL